MYDGQIEPRIALLFADRRQDLDPLNLPTVPLDGIRGVGSSRLRRRKEKMSLADAPM